MIVAAFDYIALDREGRRTKGTISADSARSARKELRLRQLSPLEVNEANQKQASSARQISSADRVLLTRQLAMLIRSGSTVEEAIGAVASQAERPAVRSLLLSVRSSVTEGFRLSEALATYPKVFNPLYRAVVSAGEGSGKLGDVMDRLATYLENAQKVRRKVLGAVIYPIILTCVALVVVIALMTVIVPRVVEQFDTLGGELPPLTRAVIGVSDLIVNSGVWIALGVAIIALVLSRAFRIDGVRRIRDRLLLGLPLFGKLTRNVNASRFARTYSTLESSGSTALESLGAARGAMTNMVFRDAVDAMIAGVREGASLSRTMRQTAAFPPLLTTLVASGESGGDLAGMMAKGADYLEDEFESSTSVALSLLEPLIILLLGGMVAVIVLAIMLPILQLNASLV